MDLKEAIAVARPHLLKMYLQRDLLGLMNVLSQNDYLKTLGILPSTLYPSDGILQVHCSYFNK